MEKEDIAIGKTVRLASGGPLMTINEYPVTGSTKDMVECIFFDGADVVTLEFKLEVLVEDFYIEFEEGEDFEEDEDED